MYKPDKRKMGHGAERKDRHFQILTILYEQKIGISEGSEIGLTMQQIARKMSLAPSQHVRDMLYEMYDKKWIVAETVTRKNGMIVVFWMHRDGIQWSDQWKDVFDAWYDSVERPLPMFAGEGQP